MRRTIIAVFALCGAALQPYAPAQTTNRFCNSRFIEETCEFTIEGQKFAGPASVLPQVGDQQTGSIQLLPQSESFSRHQAREQIQSAVTSNEQGDFSKTIKLLNPLLQSQGQRNDPLFGVGWNIIGLALQCTGDWDGARRSYERAIEILHRNPTEKVNLAAALDNLGSLKAEMGQLVESKTLRTSAKTLYQSVGDHAGIARTSINLALIALGQGNRKRVRQLLTDALSEEAQLLTPDAGDLAALYDAQALERKASGRPRDALTSINKAIQLWRDHYGSRNYLLAAGYAVRGQLEAMLHDRESAVNDYEQSLGLLRLHGDGASRNYFLIEASYAESLQKVGMRKDANHLEDEAKRGLNLLGTSCPDCTTSAIARRGWRRDNAKP
ncbi:MAG TPA: tetratricopeptide repeat protein [Verrucomicrobiae bacterium]|nr:tetratricopeptide repeat protein [Verrucomicrobiae bacterium]